MSARPRMACFACGAADAEYICTGCRQVAFCSVDCQRRAWKDHKAACAKASSSSSSSTAAAQGTLPAEAVADAAPAPAPPQHPVAPASAPAPPGTTTDEASVDFLVDALLEAGSVERVQAALAELQSCVQTLKPFRGRTVSREALEAAVQAAAARFRSGPPTAGAAGPTEPSLDGVHAQARPALPRELPTSVQARLGCEGGAKLEDMAAGRPQPVAAFGRAVQDWAHLAGSVQATAAAAEAALASGTQLETMAKQIKAAMDERRQQEGGSRPKVLLLGGLGFCAAEAERCGADATVFLQSSWQRGLARRALDAQSCKAQVVLGGSGSCVQSCQGYDMLCIEGLDRTSLGTGLWLRSARELLASTPAEALPILTPRSAAVFAALVEADGLRDCAGFDLTPAAGYRCLSPAPEALEADFWLSGEPPTSGRAVRLLTKPFLACKLWDSPQALAALAPFEEGDLSVEVVSAGRCDAVAFFVVQDGESANDFVNTRSRMGVQWLGPDSAALECGGRVALTVRRNLSRVWFALPPRTGGGEEEPRPSERAFLSPENLEALADTRRSTAYDGAIRRAVAATGKDVRVLDVGSGSGLLMMMANRAGARLVRGVERVVDLAQTSFEVFDANGMDQQDHCDMEVVCSDLLKSERAPNEAPYDVIVADLMDHTGLGGGIVPLLRHARKQFLREGGTIIPRKLTVFALLVDLGGAKDTPTSSMPWPISALHLGGSADASPLAADLGAGGLRWRALSEVKQVLSLDFSSPESLRPGEKEVVFHGAVEGIANAVCWFWLADLDEEAWLSNAPPSLLGSEAVAPGGSDAVLDRALRNGHTHWRQALVAVGPVAVCRGTQVSVRLRAEETRLSWRVEGPAAEDPMKLFVGSGDSAAMMLAEYRDFSSAWAAVKHETLTELEQAAWNLLSRDPNIRREQLLLVLDLLSQATAFHGIVGCPAGALLPRLFGGARA